MEQVTITISRATLHAVLSQADAAYMAAKADVRPNQLPTNRDLAEAKYQTAKAIRSELFDAAAAALNIS